MEGEFWQKLEARSQSNLYFALLFLPPSRRTAFRDVYRFLRAADDLVDSGLPTEQIRSGLEVWRRELDAIYSQRARHPTAKRLADSVSRYRLTRDHFETILGALAEDIGPRHFPTYADLCQWCEALSSTLGYLCLEILGAKSTTAHAYARDVGVALQLANILRDVEDDAKRGRVYLPDDELRSAGLSSDDIILGRSPEHFRVVAQEHAKRARSLIAGARLSLTPALRRELLVPEIWADVYLELLAELERNDYDVFRRTPYVHRRTKLKLAVRRWLSLLSV